MIVLCDIEVALRHLFIKPVRPPLHHFSALIEILSMVVNSTHRSAVGMSELHFDSFVMHQVIKVMKFNIQASIDRYLR